MANNTLYTWGSIPFQIYPMNVHEINHETSSDWSKKEIAGAAMYREWVGENDEQLTFQGTLFPQFFAAASQRRGAVSGSSQPRSGLMDIDVLDNMRRLGQAHALVRGDGWHVGWFVIEKMTRGHTFLGMDGVGQKVTFEITFQRVPVPLDPNAYFPALWGPLQGGGG